MTSATKSNWIVSPRWDITWMFSGLWAPALIALSYLMLSDEMIPKEPINLWPRLTVFFLALGILHRMSTTYAVLCTPILQDDIKKNPRRYIQIPLAIVMGCMGLSTAFAFHASLTFIPALFGEIATYFVLAYIMMVWELWHFCAQEFGVLSLYRIKAKQFAPADKKFDRAYTVLLMMIINPVLFFAASFAEYHYILLHSASFSLQRGGIIDDVALGAISFSLVIILSAIIREVRHPNHSKHKIAVYILIGGHSWLVYLFPNAMGLFFLSYIFHHWMVAVGLFNRIVINSYDAPSAISAARTYVIRVVPVALILVAFYLTFGPYDKPSFLLPLPDATTYARVTVLGRTLIGLTIGAFFALNFLHFYYDRCLYRFSEPSVREKISPLLFGTSGANRADSEGSHQDRDRLRKKVDYSG